ncbi:CdaR family protein [Oceanobacillus halotolerans]|uniref:CdaR family protein n=1 Tax=Oceanobacillus halotolerans TaxID=2663380 RepID=UPI0013DC0AB1|nr:CdaR family protein [Oceanobacillus halotolerans]
MDNWFNSKWFVRVISLAFAILLYVVVYVDINETQSDSRIPDGSGEIQTLDDVPVGIVIDEEKYVVRGVPEYVSVTLEGPQSTLTLTTTQRNFNVFVDLEGLGEGEHTVDIQHENISNDLGVYIEPKTIDVTIEERATQSFDVSVDFVNTNQLPEGYELGDVEVNPDTITITSSKSTIEQIALVKVFVDVAGATESINNREVPVNVYDSQGNELGVRVEPASVNVSVEVDNPSKIVPVSVETTGDLPDGYSLLSVTPHLEEVEVFATSDVLEGIEGITTEEINLEELTSSQTINASLVLPSGASVPNGDTIQVDVKLEQTRTIEDVLVDVENVPDGQEVTFVQPDEDRMGITIVGNEEDVGDLSSEDFRLVADVSGLGEGEHQIPVTVEGPDDISTELEFEEITIDLS